MPPHVPPPHPPLARRKWRPGMWPWVLVVAVLVLGLVVLVSLLAGDTAGPAPAPTQPSAPAVAAPADEGIGDGTWIVGTQITPGTYGGGARPGEVCEASTHRGATSATDLIDRVTATDAPVVIEVGDDAGVMVTAGCQPWQLIN